MATLLLRRPPLTTNMRFYSDYYRACVQHATSWCNIPNKARFHPTEQMIVAYHKGTVVYAYKGVFNRNIDYEWSGVILMDHRKIIDQCTANNGVHPSPHLRSHCWDYLQQIPHIQLL